MYDVYCLARNGNSQAADFSAGGGVGVEVRNGTSFIVQPEMEVVRRSRLFRWGGGGGLHLTKSEVYVGQTFCST